MYVHVCINYLLLILHTTSPTIPTYFIIVYCYLALGQQNVGDGG